jgi:molybdenum cofactor synthesis domain-containing protein
MQREGYNIEIIATGDEILFGRINDTNSTWIAKRATELGARIRRIICVGDDNEEIAWALKDALKRENNLIIFTGGLGPSEDDKTVQSIGEAIGRDVILDQGAVKRISSSYLERGIQNTSRGLRMARILEGSKALLNVVGMATGMMLSENNTTIMTFPGVPEELKAMFEVHATPFIDARVTSKYVAKTVTARVVFKDFFPVYRKIKQDFPDAYIKNAATPPESAEERLKVKEIKVDVVVEGSNQEESEKMMERILIEFDTRLQQVGGNIIYSYT